MEYVDGCTLEQRLAERGRLPLAGALEVFRRVAAAIAAAHACDLLHCDIKPANILISTAGEVKLTDFTLARRLADGAFRGLAGGSVDSAAPEQLRGEAAGPRTDVYGLGALLRRMIDPEEGSPEMERVLRAIERATAFDPAERFARVEDLLEALPAGGPAITRVAPLSRTRDLTRVAPGMPRERAAIRRWPLAALGALCAACLVACGALFSHFTVSAAPTRITVPDLVATQSQSAQIVVRSFALRYRLVPAYSPTVPSGIVISQQPGPGSQIPSRGTVTLVVSQGPQPVAVPPLQRLSRDVAVRELQRLGLRAVVQTQDDISDDAGIVLDQQPSPGTLRVPGSVVTITVSTKPWWWIF